MLFHAECILNKFGVHPYTLQCFLHMIRLMLQLAFIAPMLPDTASAKFKMRARCLDTIRARNQNLFRQRLSSSLFRLIDNDLHSFSWQRLRNGEPQFSRVVAQIMLTPNDRLSIPFTVQTVNFRNHFLS